MVTAQPNYIINNFYVQSPPPPPNTADLGTDEKEAVFGNQRYWESYINYKTLIWDLEMGSGIGGRGIGRGGIGGDDCMTDPLDLILM